MDHFPFVEFHGGPWQLGWSHGERFHKAIGRQLAETIEAAQTTGKLTRDEALAWSEAQLPKIAAIATHWIEELRGLAAGAEISLAEAAALQVRPGTGAMPEGCTAFGICGDAAADGQPLVGQNRDLAPAYRERMFMLLLRPERGSPIVMHNVPGELGGVGMNGHGVCVFANTLWAKSGRTWMAPPVLRRAVLECATADEAVTRVKAFERAAVGSFLIADAAGCVRNLEILPEGVAVQAFDRGTFAHANNCVDAGLQAHQCELADHSPGSEPRREWLSGELERRRGQLSIDVVKSLLASHDSQPESLCRHAREGKKIETATAMIAQPSERKLTLSYGPPCEGRFKEYAITPSSQPGRTSN